jgi:hypothetical protein
MASFAESMAEYKKQLAKGYLQVAYQGLMAYFRRLRSHFRDKYPEFSVSGSMYYGYMDMTYFSIVPEELKRRKLKIAIVFVYDPFRFEVWLSGSNREIQSRYWDLLNNSGFDRYRLALDPRSVDYVMDHVLVEDPDFSDLEQLTGEIERETLAFIQDVQEFLSGLND